MPDLFSLLGSFMVACVACVVLPWRRKKRIKPGAKNYTVKGPGGQRVTVRLSQAAFYCLDVQDGSRPNVSWSLHMSLDLAWQDAKRKLGWA